MTKSIWEAMSDTIRDKKFIEQLKRLAKIDQPISDVCAVPKEK